ncbi:MAG: helix-turn-helix domain-containing protein, partial [Aquipseudomonas alcaligenes]
MSALLLGKVLATNIPTGPKFVLTVLADHANDFGGSCFPSVPLIADKCSQTEVSVRKHI